ncbi:MAG: histidine phosphatase family protein [Janthinobacterium lividum]
MQTLFHLVRHGQYGLIDRALGGRAPGHALNAAGREEAGRVAGALRGRTVAAVVSSPVQRAQETAAPIAAALGLAVETDAALVELDCGEWTGMTFDTLRERPEWHRWNRFRSSAAIPGGETMLAVQARTVAALERLRAAHGDAEVVVVSHADVIKAALLHVLGAPLDHMGRLEVGPGSRSVVAWHDETARVLAANLPPGA